MFEHTINRWDGRRDAFDTSGGVQLNRVLRLLADMPSIVLEQHQH